MITSQCCGFFRAARLVPAAHSCIVMQSLGEACALCSCCEEASHRVTSARKLNPVAGWLWTALAVLMLACGGESSRSEPSPAPSSSSECVSFPWEVTPAELASGTGGGFDWCAGRMYPQTVFVGCDEPPRDACAWAENSGRPDAWCCW